jgi:NADH-quinone oxidoreductase subunit G
MAADKNPNRRGLQMIANGIGLAVDTFENLSAEVSRGAIKALYALGSEIPDEAFVEHVEKLELFILQSTHESPLAAKAHVLLPATTHVEDEGTFTQMGGITQRFRRAFPPRQDAQPHWKWAAELGTELGEDMSWKSSRAVFQSLSSRVPELAQFEWDKQTPMNVKQGINVPAAAADGRPPGWREFGPPRIKGI